MLFVDNLRGDIARHGIVLLEARRRDAEFTAADREQALAAQLGFEAAGDFDVLTENVGANVCRLMVNLGRFPEET